MDTNAQIHKYTKTQIHKYTKRHNYTNSPPLITSTSDVRWEEEDGYKYTNT